MNEIVIGILAPFYACCDWYPNKGNIDATGRKTEWSESQRDTSKAEGSAVADEGDEVTARAVTDTA